MAFDGIFLNAVKTELEKALGAKVERIFQPERDEVVLNLHCFGISYKLLLCASSTSPRIHFTNIQKENPTTAPMFCMVLRKHLSGAKLIKITQDGLERALRLSFDCYNDLGDLVQKHLIIEIMGRHSNIIFADDNERIIDSIKHIDLTVSSQRQVLIGMKYENPPAQNKLDLLNIENINKLLEEKKAKKLDKFLLEILGGISPLISRELSYLSSGQTDIEIESLSEKQRENLKQNIKKLSNLVKTKHYEPVMLIDKAENKPFEFSFMEIAQYSSSILSVKAESFSELLDKFYEEKVKTERSRQRSRDIVKVINLAKDRIVRKLNAQKAELEESKDCERQKLFGDLISANMYRIIKGDKEFETENFYDEKKPIIKIPLDENITPSRNAQRFYKEYRKQKNAVQYLEAQLSQGASELVYLETVLDGAEKAEIEAELNEIREELTENGYLKTRKKTAAKKREVSQPMEFKTPEGFTILTGKNNLQNDRLTLKTASKSDLWFHIKSYAGSHTVLFLEGKKATEKAKITAAQIAAYFSRAKGLSKTAVDYTEVKNVKKPSGAKAGYVIYDNYNTLYVTPDKEFIENLRIK